MDYVIIFILIISGGIFGLIVWLWRRNRGREKKEAQKELKQEGQLKKESSPELISRLIPQELYDILEIKDISDISLKEQKYFSAVVMNINTDEFSQLIHQMETREVFHFINDVLDKIVPIVYEREGAIDKFQDAGLTAFFYEKWENALVAAVSICEIINEMAKRREDYWRFSIGLCYGNVMVGVVGHERRLSILTISEYTGLSQWLVSIAGKYYARILLTASYAEMIENFSQKFNSRFLGYIYIRDLDQVEKIYDVFDGDSKEARNKKRQTKMLFEKGVQLFSKQDFMEARRYFIEVLKNDRFDKAAREYVYLCDCYINGEGEPRIFIECYG